MGLENFVECGNIRLDQQLKFVAEIDTMTAAKEQEIMAI